MKLLPGDLVKLSPFSGGQPVNLHPKKQIEPDVLTLPSGLRISYLYVMSGVININDVCIVISVDKSDCSNIYVMGPGGLGWVLGAYLTNLSGGKSSKF